MRGTDFFDEEMEMPKINTNDLIVMNYLESERKPVTRGIIVAGTDVKWSTCYDALARLLAKGHVTRKIAPHGKIRGRPMVYWTFKSWRGFYA